MGGGHVVSCGRIGTLAVAARMAGRPAPMGEDFDRAKGNSQFDFLAHQLMRDAVVVVLELDVIVDIDPGTFPVSQRERERRQWSEKRRVQRLEGRAAAS